MMGYPSEHSQLERASSPLIFINPKMFVRKLLIISPNHRKDALPIIRIAERLQEYTWAEIVFYFKESKF